MPRGRKPLPEPRTNVNFRIKTRLLAELDLLFHDPMRDKTKYSVRNEYIESLIEADLDRLRRKQQGLPEERPQNAPLEKE